MAHQQVKPSAPPPDYEAAAHQLPPGYPGTQPVPPQFIPQQVEGVCKEWIPFNMSGTNQLGYIDIQPKCLDAGSFELRKPPVFEPFSKMIEVANAWLRIHPTMAVFKCETTEQRLQKLHASEGQTILMPLGQGAPAPVGQTNAYQGGQGHGQAGRTQSLTYDIDRMLKHEAQQGLVSYVKGLRVWMRDKPGGGPPQQIGMLDTVPDEETIEVPQVGVSDGFFVQAGKVMSYVSKVMNYKHYITFKGLQATMDKLNNSTEKHPIPGDVINLELVTFKRQFEESVSRDLDPDQTAAMVDLDKVSRYTKVLRLYYAIGAPSPDPIAVHALVPEVTRVPPPGGMGRPQFQKESQLYASFAAWLGQNQGVVIKSIVQTPVRFHYQQDTAKVVTAFDSMDEVKETYKEHYFLNVRLIFYSRPTSGYVAPVTCLTSRVFLPLRTGLKAYENIGQTMERISAWLRVTGLPVYHIETMEMLFTENDKQGVNTERTDYLARPSFGLYFVVAYKLYFTSLFQEPDPRTQPPTIDWMTQGDPSMSCQIL